MTLPAQLPIPSVAPNFPITPPMGFNYPGGVNLPQFTSQIAANVPIIGTIGDMTGPNETFPVLGKDLTTVFAVWAEGATTEVTALRGSGDRAQLVNPKEFQLTTNIDSTSTAKRSVNIIWAKNANGWSAPMVINRPEILAINRKHKWRYDADRVMSVYGKNFTIPSRINHVIVQRNTDRPIKCHILHRDDNEIKFELPPGHQPGDQKVWVHNGSGGIYGLSEPMSFVTADINYNLTTVINVDDMVGATDQLKMVAAYAAAVTAGGATIQFGNRSYTQTAEIYTNSFGNNGAIAVWLKGHEGGQTEIKATGTERLLNIVGNGSRITNIKFDGVPLAIHCKDNIIDNVWMRVKHTGGCVRVTYSQLPGGYKARNGVNCIITNSTFYAVDSSLELYGSDIYVDNCKFYGFYNGTNFNYDGTTYANNNLENHGISARNTRNLIITNCKFESEDVAGGKIMTRMVGFYRSGDNGNVVKDCRGEWVGAFQTSPNADRNTGEMIMFHGDDYQAESTISVLTGNPLTMRLAITFADFTTAKGANMFQTFTEYADGWMQVGVLSGFAKGQIRTVTNVTDDGSGNTLVTFDKPFTGLVPQVGDRVQIRSVYMNNVVANNYIDALPNTSVYTLPLNHSRVGVALWVTSHNNVIQNNTFKHCLMGVYVANTNGNTWYQGRNYILGNTMQDMLQGSPFNDDFTKFVSIYMAGAQGTPNGKLAAFGQTIRNNICSGAQLGIQFGAYDYTFVTPNTGRNSAWFDSAYNPGADTGSVNDIIEKNQFSNISTALYGLTQGPNYSLFRNNTYPSAQAISSPLPAKLHQPLLIVGDVVIP